MSVGGRAMFSHILSTSCSLSGGLMDQCGFQNGGCCTCSQSFVELYISRHILGPCKIIVSASLSINIIERKCYSYSPVAYPICRSVCVSVCPESVLWLNGWLDPDAMWGGEWGWSKDGCVRWGPRAPKGRGGFGGLSSPLVWMAYF